jgi:hypothetical protein
VGRWITGPREAAGGWVITQKSVGQLETILYEIDARCADRENGCEKTETAADGIVMLSGAGRREEEKKRQVPSRERTNNTIGDFDV